jgi:hypothetical protein
MKQEKNNVKQEKEQPYPAGHNWEGLTPSQVKEGYNENKKREKKFCKKCGRESKINYCDSIMDYTHGFITHYCRSCYIKKLIGQIEEMLDTLKNEIELYQKERRDSNEKGKKPA